MATTVVCPNPDCPEHNVPKDNPADFPIEEIRCGNCGEPVEAADE